MVLVALFKDADIFYELTDSQLQMIASICVEERYTEGQIIFEEGSEGQALYVIASGEVEIRVRPAANRDGRTEPVTIATLRRGQSFGEVALVDQGLRSAIACCSQPDTVLIAIERDKLMLLCDNYPLLGYRLMRNLAADLAMKIRNTDLQVREFISWTRRI